MAYNIKYSGPFGSTVMLTGVELDKIQITDNERDDQEKASLERELRSTGISLNYAKLRQDDERRRAEKAEREMREFKNKYTQLAARIQAKVSYYETRRDAAGKQGDYMSQALHDVRMRTATELLPSEPVESVFFNRYEGA